MAAPTAPSLPFPVFQASQKVERYLLYDTNIITWLRKEHHILGVLIGSLPQIPQQNVFLGLPLEIQAEEARLLVEKGLAYIVNDLEWHVKYLASMDTKQKEETKINLRQEAASMAKGYENFQKSRTQKALNKRQENTTSTHPQPSIPTPAPAATEEKAEESLFNDSTTQETTQTPSPQPPQTTVPEPHPWTITPTASYPLPLSLPPPTSTPSTHLPTVNPSSYALFKHLHKLGYFLSPGLRFGCQFSVYPGDPLRFHSHFLSMSAEWDEELDLLDLIGGGRLGTGVKKGWLVGGVGRKAMGRKPGSDGGESGDGGGDDGTGVRTFCIEWGGM